MKHKYNKGFTLIEVSIVIVILIIITSLVAPSVIKYVKNAEYRNCEVRISNMTEEIKNACLESRFDYTSVDTAHLAVNSQIQKVVNKYAEIPVCVDETTNGFQVVSDSICLDLGIYTLKWSFADKTENSQLISSAISFTVSCNRHNTQKHFTTTIAYRQATSTMTFDDYIDLINRLSDATYETWKTHPYPYNDKQRSEFALEAFKKILAEEIAVFPDFAQYVTDDIFNYYTKFYIDKTNGLNAGNIIKGFVDDYFFQDIMNPQLVYNGVSYNILLRTQGYVADKNEYLYFAHANNGKNETNFSFVCYRKIIDGASVVQWYMYSKDGINGPDSLSFHLTGTDATGQFGGQTPINSYIESHPQNFILIS